MGSQFLTTANAQWKIHGIHIHVALQYTTVELTLNSSFCRLLVIFKLLAGSYLHSTCTKGLFEDLTFCGLIFTD